MQLCGRKIFTDKTPGLEYDNLPSPQYKSALYRSDIQAYPGYPFQRGIVEPL